MRWCAIFVCSTVLSAAEIGGANVRTVYLMPMSHGLDQYVASRLTRARLLEVVTDPERADAIFTDHLGASLNSELDKLSKPAPSAAKEESEDAEEEASAGDKSAGDKKEEKQNSPQSIESGGIPPASSFGRGKGTVFLVDAKSRLVLWSLYRRTKRFSPDELDETARNVVDSLKRDLAGK